jgi:hypothetical protein
MIQAAKEVNVVHPYLEQCGVTDMSSTMVKIRKIRPITQLLLKDEGGGD